MNELEMERDAITLADLYDDWLKPHPHYLTPPPRFVVHNGVRRQVFGMRPVGQAMSCVLKGLDEAVMLRADTVASR